MRYKDIKNFSLFAYKPTAEAINYNCPEIQKPSFRETIITLCREANVVEFFERNAPEAISDKKKSDILKLFNYLTPAEYPKYLKLLSTLKITEEETYKLLRKMVEEKLITLL